MAHNSLISKSDVKGALATLSSRLHRDVTLVVYGDIEAVLGTRDLPAYQNSLKRIDYTVRFHPDVDVDTAHKIERLIVEIASGARDRLNSEWMSCVDDVRMPFHLNEHRHAGSDIIEDSLKARDVIYKRGHLTLVAAPLYWTVAIKLLWNGQQDIEYLAHVFAASNFFGFDGREETTSKQVSNEAEDAYERQQRQIEARVTHIRSWLDARCPRMKPALQSEIKEQLHAVTNHLWMRGNREIALSLLNKCYSRQICSSYMLSALKCNYRR
ncbi:hypothetical protein SCHPADRAFT_399670 [Schizopora paradoxa]|uniref:Uncharacterized protein n=1 Tax=Schizopora paradoxa TaxID=27342 RepID=A0A0H2RLI2_9AGAM|nr:hypothetical protein SCHPADRAFT_399670 [Schizopora paradoxa]